MTTVEPAKPTAEMPIGTYGGADESKILYDAEKTDAKPTAESILLETSAEQRKHSYPCGCAATGNSDLPRYCPVHGTPPDTAERPTPEPCRHGMFSHRICEICAEVIPLEQQVAAERARADAAGEANARLHLELVDERAALTNARKKWEEYMNLSCQSYGDLKRAEERAAALALALEELIASIDAEYSDASRERFYVALAAARAALAARRQG